MDVISLAAATTLTEWSERTFWRRFTEGSIERLIRNGKAVIGFDAIAGHLCIPLEEDDLVLLQQADAGDPRAQTDMALIFLAHKKPKGALAWLNLAVKQQDASAMYLLGRFYIDAHGSDRDENLGMMWLSKAACYGNGFATVALESIRRRIVGP
jgi:TPR repeat protein